MEDGGGWLTQPRRKSKHNQLQKTPKEQIHIPRKTLQKYQPRGRKINNTTWPFIPNHSILRFFEWYYRQDARRNARIPFRSLGGRLLRCMVRR